MILLAALAALSGGGDPSIVPIPIGPGARYRPAVIVRDGSPVGAFRCGPPGTTFRVHIELFAQKLVVVVPQGIGVAKGGCVYPARTLLPTGVVEVSRGAKLTLGDLFAIWGASSGRTGCSRSARSSPWWRTSRASATRYLPQIPLTPNAQIVVEIGGYVPPHRTISPPRRSP